LPRKSFSTSPPLFRKPSAPSRSIFPAHTFHRIGRSLGDPMTRPRDTNNVENSVSRQISSGSDFDVFGVVSECCVAADVRAACSCAEYPLSPGLEIERFRDCRGWRDDATYAWARSTRPVSVISRGIHAIVFVVGAKRFVSPECR
jgi:hypothetical protein